MKTASITITISLVLVVSLAGCAGMTDDQQRMVSGGAMGAAGGAVLGAVTGGSALIGAAVGGAAGVAGGALVNQQQKAKATKAKKKKTAPAKLENKMD